MAGARSLLACPLLYGSPARCSCLSRQARLWSTYASKIEPGQGGGRLMGLDGHQAPPIPSRPILRKPRRAPRGGVFLLGAKPELCPPCPGKTAHLLSPQCGARQNQFAVGQADAGDRAPCGTRVSRSPLPEPIDWRVTYRGLSRLNFVLVLVPGGWFALKIGRRGRRAFLRA